MTRAHNSAELAPTDLAPTDPAAAQVSQASRPIVQRGFAARLVRRPAAVASGMWLLLVGLAAISPRIFTSNGFDDQNLLAVLKGPSAGHLLGTDSLGRDLLVKLIHGARPTVWGMLVAVVIGAVLGVVLGLVAGYQGGWIDTLIQRIADLLFSIPGLIILLVVFAVFPFNLTAAMATLGVLFSSGFMRLIRGVTLQTREELFVAAARVSGLSSRQIIFRHLLPRMSSLVIVQASLLSSIAVLVQSSLAFVGFGPRPPRPSWGSMLAEARIDMSRQNWVIVPAGLAIAVTVIALNIFGDAVRDTAAERWTVDNLRRRKRTRRRAIDQLATLASPAEERPQALLSVQHLSIAFPGDNGPLHVVTDVSFDIAPGEVVGIVGESGCGKSMTALGVLGMLPAKGSITAGAVVFEGHNLVGGSDAELSGVRGRRIGYVSQEPQVALDPTFRIGSQVAEAVRTHRGCSKAEARRIAVELFEAVNLPDPVGIAQRYPHQISGGQAQRVVIALALAGEPSLLIADEPTTALDVTIQAEILALLRRLGRERGLAIMLITHNWGVVADLCERAVVMYAGQVVEQGGVSDLFHTPAHPYTQGLLRSNPHTAARGTRLATIAGNVPLPHEWPTGCRFAARCEHTTDACRAAPVALTTSVNLREVRCIRSSESQIADVRVEVLS